MAEPPTPDNGGVVPLLLLLEDAIDAGRKVDMVVS
jgi:hypothetical protein